MVAPVVEVGHAEEFIGRSVSHRRDEFVIATKCGCNWRGRSRNRLPKQFTRVSVFKNIDRSLKRLKTDHVDFLQFHNPKSAQVEDNELIDALLEVKRQGKTRWIGMSSDMPQLPPLAAFEELDVFQVGYQAMQRESEDWIKKLADDGRGIIIRPRRRRASPTTRARSPTTRAASPAEQAPGSTSTRRSSTNCATRATAG